MVADNPKSLFNSNHRIIGVVVEESSATIGDGDAALFTEIFVLGCWGYPGRLS